MEEEILQIMAKRGRMMTYVIANHLRADHPKYNGKLETSAVLRCLKKMEKAGLVKRVSSVYRVQLCWLAPQPPNTSGD